MNNKDNSGKLIRSLDSTTLKCVKKYYNLSVNYEFIN